MIGMCEYAAACVLFGPVLAILLYPIFKKIFEDRTIYYKTLSNNITIEIVETAVLLSNRYVYHLRIYNEENGVIFDDVLERDSPILQDTVEEVMPLFEQKWEVCGEVAIL